jgi:LysM repeat protein
MGKTELTFIVLLFFVNALPAQDRTLIAEGRSPNLYILHKLQARENYYSIGRMFNVTPKEIAPYNNLDFAKGLNLGQVIKIPLTQNNFLQGEAPKNDEALIPVYHIVKAKEGLYRVSITYNKVPMESLKKWNHLSTEAVSSGTKLIVGFLKVQKNVSPLAQNGSVVKDVAINNENIKSKPDAPKEIITAEKKSNVEKKQDTIREIKPVIKDQTPDNNNVPVTRTSINFNGGSFKSLYEDQQHHGKTSVNEKGISGVFKSTSGWKDGKYYCFHNTAQPGSILKITNSANGKSIYAKVLDLIPDINQNAGLILHISNSAAEELGVINNKFDCSIDYSK